MWRFILLISSWSSTQPIATARGSDLVCTRRGDTTRITVSEPWHVPFGSIIKYGLLVLAALTLPVILFKLFVLPFKLLLGLKAISFLNSLLLGTLIYKFSDSHTYGSTSVIDSVSSGGFPVVTGPLPGTLPGSSVSVTGSGSSSSSISGVKVHNSHNNHHDHDDDDEDDSDYVDVVGPDEDVERILNLVRRKNKNWWRTMNCTSWVPSIQKQYIIIPSLHFKVDFRSYWLCIFVYTIKSQCDYIVCMPRNTLVYE